MALSIKVPLGESRTLPHIAEQNGIGEFGELRGDVALSRWVRLCGGFAANDALRAGTPLSRARQLRPYQFIRIVPMLIDRQHAPITNPKGAGDW